MDSKDALLVECFGCHASGRIVTACPCIDRGVVECSHCRGSGELNIDCGQCSGRGRARAQLVITMVNLDLSTIASATVIPGVLDVVPAPPNTDAALALDVTPTLRDLAARTGGVWVDDPRLRVFTDPIPLTGCRADGPVGERLAAEARALAAFGPHRQWLFTARVEQPAPVRPDDALARLCRIADLICVDLIVHCFPLVHETASEPRVGWRILFAYPGEELPRGERASGPTDPVEVLLMTEPTSLVAELGAFGHRDGAAPPPARRIRSFPHRFPAPVVGTFAEVTAAVRAAAGADGGIGVWRSGARHFSEVRRAGEVLLLHPLSNGDIAEQRHPTWTAAEPPPDPAYWGEEIPGRPCPACESDLPWERCDCDDDSPLPDCRRCGGTGSCPAAYCVTCGETGRIHHGAVLTVTDLDGYAEHLDWRVDPDAECTVLGPVDGPPGYVAYRLPPRYRMTELTRRRDLDPADVTQLPRGIAGTSLMDGRFMGPAGMSPAELTHGFIAAATIGQPAARSFLVVAPRRYHALSGLAQICFGLGVELVVLLTDTRGVESTDLLRPPGARRWHITVHTPGGAFHCADGGRLDQAVVRIRDRMMLFVDPREPDAVIPAPQQPVPPRTDLDGLEALLSRLAARHTDHPYSIIARLSPGRVHLSRQVVGEQMEEVLVDVTSVAEAEAML